MFIAAIVRLIINLVRKNRGDPSGQNSPGTQTHLQNKGY